MTLGNTLALLAAALAFGAPRAEAQAKPFPSKPITFVVPYAPGGNIDLSARMLQAALGTSLGQPILVENRSGGGGMIAGDYVARGEPDGHTLLVGSNGPVVFGPIALPKPAYQWETAFAPISTLAIGTNVLIARNELPAGDIPGMVAYAKANPGKFTVAADTGASINHFLSELLKLRTGVRWAEVHYRGNAPAINDLVAGHLDAGFAQLFESIEHVRAGKLKVLAVLQKARSTLLPEVPTAIEQGYADVEGIVFNGLLAPKATPRPLVDKLSAAFRAAIDAPEFKAKHAALGAQAGGSTPEAFEAFLTAETAKWKQVLVQADIKIAE